MVVKRHFPEHLVDRLAPLLPTASRFQLHSLGEPLMSPAFWKILERITAVHRGKPEISFNSNGLLLSEKHMRDCWHRSCAINISFDAATAATYERIRGGDFDLLAANVASLVRARAAAGRTDFKIILNMTLMRANIEELPQFVRLAHRLGRRSELLGIERGRKLRTARLGRQQGRLAIPYPQESPRHYPNLFAAKVREAVAVARELNMPLDEEFKKKGIVAATGPRDDRDYRPWATSPTAVTSISPRSDAPAATVNAPPPTPRTLVQLSTGKEACSIAGEMRRVDGASGIPVPKSAAISKCEAPWRWLVEQSRRLSAVLLLAGHGR